MEFLRASIKESEGLSLTPYLDSRGYLTIGYGRCLDKKGISHAEAEIMLEADLYHASNQYLTLPLEKVKALNRNRRRVVVEMIFNLGLGGTLTFKKMWAAIEAGDFDSAAKEMLDSLWAQQVGERAVRLANSMRVG